MARQLATKPTTEVSVVFATSRSKNSQLQKLEQENPDRVIFVPLDVGIENSARDAVRTIELALNGKGLDVLVNNAGIVGWTHAKEMTDLQETFRVNVGGPHAMIQAFLPLMRKGTEKKIINISSAVGSIARQHLYRDLPAASYKVTKAALNMLSVVWSQELEDEGFVVLCLSPGWLKTDEANSHADLPVDVGVAGVMNLVKTTGPDGNGRFFNIKVPDWEEHSGIHQYDGKDLPCDALLSTAGNAAIGGAVQP